MTSLKQELERIWRELPIAQPGHVAGWLPKGTGRGHYVIPSSDLLVLIQGPELKPRRKRRKRRNVKTGR